MNVGTFWMQCKRKNLIYSFADSSVIGDKHLLANSGRCLHTSKTQ